MKLNQLRDVVAIVEHGSLRAASRHLGLAQPALSKSVRELERELGAPLFERRARGMVLTPMGEVLARRASGILKDVQRVTDEVNQLSGSLRGTVVVALSLVAHLIMFPRVLQAFRARYPDVILHVIEGFYPTVEQGLKEGGIDFYCGPEPKQPVPPELSTEPLFDNMRVVIGRKGHPMAGCRSLEELASAEWATTSITNSAEDEFAALFTAQHLPPPKLVLRSQSALTIVMALMNSDLLAMLPQQWRTSGIFSEFLSEIPVVELLPAPPMVLIRRSGLPLTPAAEFLSDLLRRGAEAQARP